MADDSEIKVGSVWHRDGKRFVVVRTSESVKDASAANWSPCIAYQEEAADEPVRNRARADFLSKFTPDGGNA